MVSATGPPAGPVFFYGPKGVEIGWGGVDEFVAFREKKDPLQSPGMKKVPSVVTHLYHVFAKHSFCGHFLSCLWPFSLFPLKNKLSS
jgi:hypothetical protein